MVESLAPFIDAGWYTVPFTSAKITRVKGKKNFKILTNWKDLKQPNEMSTPVGAALVGKDANLIVIDCDTSETTDLIEQLNPYDDNIAWSVGKIDKDGNPIRGASFFFSWTDGIPDTFNNGRMGMELFSSGQNRMVFLPTAGNESKMAWDKVPELKPVPDTILNLMKIWKIASEAEITSNTIADATMSFDKNKSTVFKLFPLVELALKTPDVLNKGLFTILTPKSYRNNLYKKKTYLEPNDIPEGSGSDYLMKVSAILGSDISINEDFYRRTMNYIINFFDHARRLKHLKSAPSEIMNPMIIGSSSINGEPIWRYDENWRSHSLTVVSKLGYTVEFFYDPERHLIFEINHTKGSIKRYEQASKVAPNIAASVRERFPTTGPKLLEILPNFESVLRPNEPFGLINQTDYNVFHPTRFLEIINNPITHKDNYVKPELFIEYMESLVPNEEDREYLLRHLRTKLTTFQHSPVIYYFVGASGSGKSLFVRILRDIMSDKYISMEMGAEHIVGQFNKWLDGIYFAHLDELYNSLDSKDINKANGNLKRYTGSNRCQIRGMNSNHYDTDMNATFILTQNGSSMNFDRDDRRYFYIDTPTKLPTHIASVMFDDYKRGLILADVMYWLATEFSNLDGIEYTTAPFTESKKELILNKLPLVDRMAIFIEDQMYDSLYELALGVNMQDELMAGQPSSRVLTSVICDIYDAYNPSADNSKTEQRVKTKFKKMLTNQPRHPYTTINGENKHYIRMLDFDNFIIPLEDDYE